MFQYDEARPFCSEEVRLYFERRGIMLQVVPVEAHTRLGIVKRRHMVLRTAVENYMEDSNLEKTWDAVREAVNLVAPVMNTLSFSRGYTPTQWVLSSNPKDPSQITADDFNPTIHHDALTDPDFETELQRRTTASSRRCSRRLGIRESVLELDTPPSV
jgi:hypothetical protein